jgi:hypothetical protein
MPERRFPGVDFVLLRVHLRSIAFDRRSTKRAPHLRSLSPARTNPRLAKWCAVRRRLTIRKTHWAGAATVSRTLTACTHTGSVAARTAASATHASRIRRDRRGGYQHAKEHDAADTSPHVHFLRTPSIWARATAATTSRPELPCFAHKSNVKTTHYIDRE